jgi:hypothetical protein
MSLLVLIQVSENCLLKSRFAKASSNAKARTLHIEVLKQEYYQPLMPEPQIE